MKSTLTKTLKISLAASAAAAPLMVAPAPVLAQSGPVVTDEFIVSARRREESLQDVPIAVTAVTGDQLDALGAVDITSIQRLTPNATIEVARGTNTTLIAFIRGVGQQDPLWGFEPGVGIYVDDVFIARPQAAVLDIFDVERVEVLRGPQGTLYGRNTIGGAIKYVTRDLNMEEPEVRLRANVGTFGQFDQIGTVSFPVSDTFALGASVANFKRDGYGENLNTGAEHYDKDLFAARFSAQWMPTDSFSLRFAADMTDDTSNAKHGHRLVPSADGTVPVTSDVFDTRAGIGDDNSVESRGVSLTAEWDINDIFTVKSITAYRESETTTPIDFDALPQPDFDVPARYDDDQFSQELQLLFEADRLSGIVGVYYLDGSASGEFDAILESIFGGFTVYTSGLQEKENFSVFGDFTYDLTDRLSVSLGGRYTKDDTTADVLREGWLGLGSGSFDPTNTTSVFFATQTGYEGLTRSDEQFTPRVSISYDFSDNLTTYASYSQGFKAGGFDPRAREDLDPLGLSREGFEPEVVDSYEIGLKGSLFDNAVNFSTAVFYAEYTDQQIQVQTGADSDNDGINDTFVSSVFNAGESEYFGVEFEGAWFITDSFNLSTVIGYIDAQINEVISAGANVGDQFVTQNTPELTARLAANYVHTLPDGYGDVSVTASASYRDEYNLFNVDLEGFGPGVNPFFPNGGPPLDPDAYTLLDLSAVWTSESEKWSVGIHGRNLTDEEYRVAAYNFLTPAPLGLDSAYSAFYGAPRTVTATFEFRY